MKYKRNAAMGGENRGMTFCLWVEQEVVCCTLSSRAGRPDMRVSKLRAEPSSMVGSARRLKASWTKSHGVSWPASAIVRCLAPAGQIQGLQPKEPSPDLDGQDTMLGCQKYMPCTGHICVYK